MIIAIIASVMIGAFFGAALMACLSMMSKTEQEPEKEKTTILTPGCTVKYEGRIWTILRFTEDSKRRTIAEIESYDNEKHIIRRTMAAVEDLEGVEENEPDY